MLNKRSLGIVLVCGVLLSASAGALAGSTLHVATTGDDAQDGLTWATAKQTVTAGLAAAVAGDEVWVARGTYVERITLVDGVALYGGFAGTEQTLAERAAFPRPTGDENETVLDGNREGSVVTGTSCPATTRIDGFTIRNGHSYPGGGITCRFGAPIITNNTITGNTTTTESDGNVGSSAIDCENASPLIADNIIAGNTAQSDGSIIRCRAGGSPTITRNVIRDNDAGSSAAAIRCYGSSATVTHNLIRGNRGTGIAGWGTEVFCLTISGNVIAGNDGAGIHCIGDAAGSGAAASVTVSGNTIVENSTGIYCSRFSAPGLLAITNNTITRNRSTGIGCGSSDAVQIAECLIAANSAGGIYCQDASPTITKCRITGNWNAGPGGGGIACIGRCTPLIANCVICGNVGNGRAGGILCGDPDAKPTIVNCTITGNAATYGGAVYIYGGAPTIVNCIVAFNSSGLMNYLGNPTLRRNDVYGNTDYDYSGLYAGSGSIALDPKLVAAEYGEIHLQANSPCIDQGDDTVVATGAADVDGQARIQGTHVDLGADEFDGTVPAYTPDVVRVSLSGDDEQDGSSWAQAKRTVQAGIDAAAIRGGEVWIAAGTYEERITLRSCVSVYGSFSGVEASRAERVQGRAVTTLDGGAAGCVVTASKCGHWVSRLDACTVRNGNTTIPGGGIMCVVASPILTNNRIADNVARDGGGIWCSNGSHAVISDNLIYGNEVGTGRGGGILSSDSKPTIQYNSIVENHAGSGGGVEFYQSAGVIMGNRIHRNGAGHGGGICVDTYEPVIVSNEIVGNTASDDQGGGGIFGPANGSIVNNTIVGNSAIVGGGVHSSGGANNIVAFNSSGFYSTCSICGWAYNNVYGNTEYDYDPAPSPDMHNISVDPGFVDPGIGDYHLAFGSPCIDAGHDGRVQAGWTDVDTQARIQGAHVDIGADEFAWSEVLGACCVNWVCSVQLEATCVGMGGTFKGIGTTCVANACRCAGDGNCDHVVNWRDIDFLVAAMGDNEWWWSQQFPGGVAPCSFANLDADGDGHVDWRDVDPFIALMNTTCP